ncbi:MAG: hypothetical protein U5K74_07475 [Gemmatimonadaceae bacterium]|nr:hypothetical protein [Gemmatimonadaceae bacterium]
MTSDRVRAGAPRPPEVLADSVMESSVRVFLDCQGGVPRLRRQLLPAVQEMPYGELGARIRLSSDVHLLLSQLNAGNNGREITVNLRPPRVRRARTTRWS